MGKGSSAKKVARAATTGGGRTTRGTRPYGWYTVMMLVAVVGVVLIVFSRNQRLSAADPEKAAKPRPPAQERDFPGDHWHAAYGVYLCDRFAPPIQSERDPQGIHTHNDGVIHIHPFTRAASGRKATLGVFARTVGMTLEEDRVQLPGDRTYANGDKCGDKAGRVRVMLDGNEVGGDPKDIRLRDRDMLVIAFAPEGARVPERPPSAAALDSLTDVPGSPGATSSTTQAPNPAGAPTPTTAPAGAQQPPAQDPATTAPPTSAPPGSAPPTSSP